MSEQNKTVLFILFCGLICSLPISITSIVLGATSPGECDLTDEMNLNVSQYLLSLGIVSLTFSLMTISMTLLILYDVYQKK